MEITSTQLRALIESKEELLLLDVREPYEFDEFNIGGTLIPLGDLPQKVDALEDWKEKKIITICRSGKRSMSAQHFLLSNGFADVINLTGGVLAWQIN